MQPRPRVITERVEEREQETTKARKVAKEAYIRVNNLLASEIKELHIMFIINGERDRCRKPSGTSST